MQYRGVIRAQRIDTEQCLQLADAIPDRIAVKMQLFRHELPASRRREPGAQRREQFGSLQYRTEVALDEPAQPRRRSGKQYL